MQKTKKWLCIMLSLTLVMALIVGCGDKDENADANKKDDEIVDQDNNDKQDDDKQDDDKKDDDNEKDVTLKTSTMFGGTDPATEVYKKAIEDFMSENPHIKIEDESMTSEGDGYRTKVKTDFSSGNDPDVVFFYTAADAKGLIESGKVMDYETMWSKHPDLGSAVTEASKEAMREFDGKIYALPVTGFYEGLFVNKKMFEENDLDLPTDWDKLENAVKKLKEKGIVPIAAPVGQSHYLIEHFVLSAAGAEGHKDVFSNGVNPDWVEGFNNMKKLYDMNAFSADATGLEIEGAQNLFREKKAAMILEGSWFIGGCDEELQNDMTVIPMTPAPNGKMDPKSIIGGFSSGYYISKKGYDDPDKQEAIIKLVDYLLSEEMIEKMATANGGIPAARVSVPGLSPVAQDGHKMFAEASTLNMPIDSRLTPEAFNVIVKQGTPFIVTGKKTPEDVLEEVMKVQNPEQ